MKKIGLIQVDGKMPNLALMKLAAWHKAQGDQVVFIDLSTYGIGQWYASKVFIGGSGYDLKAKLPEGIEAQVPDYELYHQDYSIGFTSRGCIRDCDFCIVREKEGSIAECDFSKHIKHQKYLMLDNNFLASPKWKEKLRFFIDNQIKVCFTQGLDIRLINEENARLLSKTLYYDWKFSRRTIYFAFDDPSQEPVFREKISILLKYIKPSHIMIYILVGHNTTFEQDQHRFNVVREYGCDPFIMIYNNKRNQPHLRHFARWVNKRIYKACKWEEYQK